MERKLFTALQGDDAQKLNDGLSQQGFRRSQNVLYRPSCESCSACLSARIDVSAFQPTKSQRRVIKRNAHLQRRATSPWATEAQYELFRTYLESRHADGGMADMDVFEFAAMVEETPIRSRVIEYTDTDSRDLTAVSLTDVLSDGVSMVSALKGESFTREKPIFWEWRAAKEDPNTWPYQGIRLGKWKLLVNEKLGKAELYDIEVDWAETTDVSKDHPETLEKLVQQIKAWKKTLPTEPPADCFSKHRK